MVKMSQKFNKTIQIKFRDADPAGILFFGNLLALSHDCFEDFIAAVGITWKEWFTVTDFMIPIRHTETNYLAPMPAGEIFVIEASVASLGETSFKMKYQFKKSDKVHAEAMIVHAFMSAKTKQKMPIPETLRKKLSVYLETP